MWRQPLEKYRKAISQCLYYKLIGTTSIVVLCLLIETDVVESLFQLQKRTF